MTLTQPDAQSFDQVLDQLRQQYLALLTDPAVQSYWQQQGAALEEQFQQQRDNLRLQIDALEIAKLQALVDTLDTDKAALSEGCDNLAKEIAALNQPIAFLKALSTVLSVATQIAKPFV